MSEVIKHIRAEFRDKDDLKDLDDKWEFVEKIEEHEPECLDRIYLINSKDLLLLKRLNQKDIFMLRNISIILIMKMNLTNMLLIN